MASVPSTAPASPKRRDPRDTPAMRQYMRFKAEHPDCVLFFRMGDFYEMFDADAELTHKVLGLTLTQRTEGVPMAGLPYHALDGYVQRMIAAGYRVAICDQIQDPKDAKGVVDRAVTRVLTPGTLVDESLLDESEANVLLAVASAHGDASMHIAFAELSTGRFCVRTVAADRLLDELARHRPSEVIYCEPGDGAAPAWTTAARDRLGCALTERPPWCFHARDAGERLREHFGVRTLGGFGFEDDDPRLAPAGALLHYLGETQAPRGGDAGRLSHLQPPREERTDAFVTLDATTLQSLEIERTMRTGQRQGSLLSVLQGCTTAMGKRRLREWLCFPLRDRAAIEARQDAVAALVADDRLRDDLDDALGRVQDVARIAGRIGLGRATPRDLVALGISAAAVRRLADLLGDAPAFAGLARAFGGQATELEPLADDIGQRCIESPPAHLRDGGLFRDGIDDELDEARGLERDADAWLTAYQARLTAETSIPSLKVGFNKVFGYYIEITHTHTAKVPPAFSRKQTLKNAERYVTPELKDFEDKVTTARARAVEREQQLFRELCTSAATRGAALSAYADSVAELDVLNGFAELARKRGYVRPVIVDERVLDIRLGRHPVLDRSLGERFVPNDCRLGGDGATLALITGPNMAGKSTAIRQAAIITLLAHTGCFVPAESATVGLVDRIFTRIGAADELHAGQSTFMVEMTETANILHHATDRSLVILDEIGRGTSTLDGLALAWAIAETIADIGGRALFATHYHELTTLADRLESVTNLHVAVREWGDEIVFLYRIEPGRTDRSYGIHVAKIAGVPAATLARARDVLDSLTVQTTSAASLPPPPPPPAATRVVRPPVEQMPLFATAEPAVVGKLRDVDLERLTPLEAFDLLRALREEARSG